MTELHVRIRPLDKATEADAFRDMFLAVYGHPMSQALWLWKYDQAPGAASINLVAECLRSGRLLGHIGAVALPGACPDRPGQSLQWVQIGDIMVREQARGDLGPQGVYRQLVRQMQQALRAHGETLGQALYAYGFPGGRPFRLGERLGYYRQIHVCEQHHYAPPTDMPQGWRGWWARRRALRVWLARPDDSFDSWADQVWCQLSPHLPGAGALKNAAYLRWRYLQHPERGYRLWWLGRHARRPLGWLVTSAGDGADAPLTLIDSLVAGSDWPAAVQALAALHPARGCQGWRAAPGAGSVPTPIVATEFGTPGFQADWPLSPFQPGDTDVY